ncbi:GDP-mannose pyrophosphatase NudK [Rhizobium sp. RU20A]|uniref:NUDIX domain-containing protein n=1 Tax=Rhizobium sp. RU20A TaxID=1907412 RepID=UPI000954D166|nr:NUDIX domain-containing protein [Rhizobium sp. RU20A]SIQ58710.1 GDP-mannose pyrophosphatase NudK [Rhizobium sp. RU20A]
MTKKLRLLSDTLIGKGWGELRDYTVAYRTSEGQDVEIRRECYHRGHAAAVLPYHLEKKTVVLVRQMRIGAFLSGDDAFLLEAAAGGLDGQEPAACAKREALEETGCRVFNLEKIADVYAMPAAVTEKVHLFLGEYDNEPRKTAGLAEEHEFIEVVELPLRDALDMIKTGQIIDMKTIILLQSLALK